MSLEGQTEVSILLSHAPERTGQSNEVEVQLEDSRFTSIKIEDFISSKAVQFDLYVKLKPGHYVKILHAGDSFSLDRINKYKFEKNVKFLYFTVEDRKKFIRVQNFLAEKTASNQKIDVATKGRVLKNVGEKLVEEIFYEGVRPQVLDQGKALCNSIYEMVNSGQNLAAMLREYQDFDPTAYSHSYLVCLFSCSLVKQFEWESKIVNETIGMAALLHDIGKLKMHKSLIALRPEDMTPDELTQYKNHPQLGLELLANQTMVTAAVKQIVLQHHERNDGTGFPYGIKRKQILTLAKMIGLIDEFVHIMVKDKIPPPKALKQMLMGKDSVERFSSGILENFIRIFVDPDKLE
jgi:putative nucleotidyltransferase with HDIG domain